MPSRGSGRISEMTLGLTLSTAANMATAAAVFVAAIALLLQRGQARTAFEDELVREYRRTVKPDLTTKALISSELDEQTFAQVADFYPYIDLCNEQVFLRLAGRVRRKTWTQWCDGIRGNLRDRDAFKNAWATMRTASPRDFGELQLLVDSGYRDPRSWIPAPWRAWLWLRRRDLPIQQIRQRLSNRGLLKADLDTEPAGT
jgi:hypothetical protein